MDIHTIEQHIYLDPDRPLSERVQDLLSRLTLEEKISQMVSDAPAIQRLGIPAYNFWSEALHGVARNGRATVFPQAIGMAATWDPDLIKKIGSAIGDEGRAKYHEALRRKGRTDIYQGLTFWSPNVNIFRDPRWGRGQETWGEDPYLTGEMGSAFVTGLQGDHPKYMKAAACAKHFAVHSGPEKLRHTFDAQLSMRDLFSTYLPAFRKLVAKARVEAVMGAYNRVNGEPCCASPYLLQHVLRDQWGFQGHVVSDCFALSDIHKDHKYTKDAVETSAVALKAGCDLSCLCTYDHLGEALEHGLISEEDIDLSLARTLTTRFKLGMFDPPERVPFTTIPMSVVNCEDHRRLAYEAACKSIVLLKNKGNILPISDSVKSIMVLGPTAADQMVLLGNYNGISPTMTTILEGIAGRVPEGVRMEYRPGCMLTQDSANPINFSLFDAPNNDLTIVCAGISPLMEGEEGESILTPEKGDRSDIGLPAVQFKFIKQLVISGAKVVLVLTGGSPVALGELAEMVHAIVWVWYPGQEGGRAVANIIFGDECPSGRLPVTFPRSIDQLPPFIDYSMDNRTYRFASWDPLYPFGYGLSYTKFRYSDIQAANQTVLAGESIDVRVSVTNEGKIRGEEVVQFYLTDREASVRVPKHSLIGFQRISLDPGETGNINFMITPEMMTLVDNEGESRLEPGEFILTVGGCSPGKRGIQLGAPEPVTYLFTLVDQ